MALWTTSQNKTAPDGGLNPRMEAPNAVIYVTFSHPDGRTKTPGDDNPVANRRHPFDPTDSGEPYLSLAQLCDRYDSYDAMVAQRTTAFAALTFAEGPMPLPDVSKQKAVNSAQRDLDIKVNAAARQQATTEAAAVDPAVAAAVQALEDAKALP